MKIVIDSVLGDHRLPGSVVALLPAAMGSNKLLLLITAVAAGFVLKLVVGGLTIQETYVNITLRQRILLALKTDLFQHLQKLSLTFHDYRRLGDSIYRVNNDAYCLEDLVANLIHLLTAALTLAGMFVIALTVDWSLALLAAAVAPFISWSVRFYFKRFNPKIERVQEMEAESMSIVHETLANLRVVKAFAREDYEHHRFLQQGRSTMRERVSLTVQQSLFAVTVGLITAAATAVLLGLGAAHVLQGALTVGELLVLLAYLVSIFGPLQTVTGTLTAVQTDLVKARRVFEILDVEPDVSDLPGAGPLGRARGRVTFENVRFAYGRGVDVLHDIEFDDEPGRVVGIVGPTGAGKTTLVSLIPRFYDVTAGRVLIDGHDVRHVQLKSLRRQVSLVLQESILFAGSMRENIAYGRPDATFDDVIEAARAANAHDFITALPQGYDTPVGERGVKLSGGERQRLAIARAFLKDASLLVLDEPTSSVDSQTETVILEALKRLMCGRTTFIIAHRLSTLRLADLIFVLRDGRIVERGTHAELLRHGDLYAVLYQAQVSSDGA